MRHINKQAIFVVLTTIIITFIVSQIVQYDIVSFIGGSIKKQSNFELSDFYASVENNWADVSNVDSNLVIVSIDGCSREQIASIIETVDYFGAKAIALDFLIVNQSQDDSILIHSIKNCQNIILPYELEYNSSNKTFIKADSTYFCSALTNAHYGCINLASNNFRDIIRTSLPFCKLNTGEYMDNFSAAILKIYSPQKYKFLKDMGNDPFNIRFHNIDFQTIKHNEIISEDNSPIFELESEFYNKIVIIGALENRYDKHMTPIGEVPGVYIHAATIHTILHDKYIRKSSDLVNQIISIIVAAIFLSFVFYARTHFKKRAAISIRLFQLIVLFSIFTIGVYVYSNWEIYINFTITLVMLSLGVLVFDIVYGSLDIINNVFNKQKNKL